MNAALSSSRISSTIPRAGCVSLSCSTRCSLSSAIGFLVCSRQHTSAYVSIRQHTSAYVSIRQHTSALDAHLALRSVSSSAHVSIRQHTSAYVSIRQHTSAYAGCVSLSCSTALDAHLAQKSVSSCNRCATELQQFCNRDCLQRLA